MIHAPIHLLCFTPAVDLDDDVRGFIHRWVEELSKRVDRLTVISLHGGRHHLPENVRLYSLQYSGNKLLAAVRLYRYLFAILWSDRPDAYFVHMIPKFAVMTVPIVRLFGIPSFLWYTHGAVSPTLHIAHLLVNEVFTASPESFNIISKKKQVLGHGIDLSEFSSSTMERKSGPVINLLFVGRLSPSKDLITVFEAIELLPSEIQKKLHLSIVGKAFPGSDRDKVFEALLRDRVKNSDLSSLVTFHGSIPHHEVSLYYQRSDIVINPSLTGSLDKSGLEALASGRPLVTCNSSYDSLLGEFSKLLYFSPNNAAMLSSILSRLAVEDRDRLSTIGQTLQERVRRTHNLQVLMDKLVSRIYTYADRTAAKQAI